MKLLTYIERDGNRLGIRTEQGVIAVAEAASKAGIAAPRTIHEAIEGGAEALSALKKVEDYVLTAGHDAAESLLLSESALSLAPCVTAPSKIICVGLNYRKHAEETNAKIPEYPILFNKFPNTLTAHGRDVALPRATNKVDYEAELVIVIGKKTKYVSREEALHHVFGYCCVNDLSARDLQLRTPQWMLGKVCDDFSPLGPYVVTADEVGDPNTLAISCTVNGEVRQSSNTSDMIFPCDEIVSYISQHFTLEPGDIILTGTPEGVVLGYPPEKQVYLQDGDIVTIEIEKLGSITNRMVNEPT
ncbi:fumarylacetoacetate hydrolase family protein [Paenibacillus sp. GCM10023252]|uniref:fumarylacetoacetate hydrolase family protein n=1 Tax=Paenibacillus sp. GCM10023252 TaxID=3252649 RepID=UPI00361DFBBC